jgi:hypothetical protein
VLISILPVPATADLAPMSYDGHSFTPVSHPDIRMARETVDIRIGDRVSADRHHRWVHVSARFFMYNDAPDTAVFDVGFPVSTMWLGSDTSKPDSERMARSLEELREMGIYDFRVSVDSGPHIELKPEIVFGVYRYRRESDYLWFRWNMAFPPGETVVDVTYNLRTNYGYWRIDQHTTYVLATGRFWKDSIGVADVRIELPAGHDSIPAYTIWPDNYERHGNVFSWHWEDYEPEPNAIVTLGFCPPEIFEELRSLEEMERQHPDDPDIAMKLAGKYLYAAYRKGPERLHHVDFAKLAEIRLQKTLSIDSTDADAWHLYLGNYSRMYKNSFGTLWYSGFELCCKQRDLVRRACRLCPGDEGMRYWSDLLQEEPWEPLKEIGYKIVRYNGLPWIELNDSTRARRPILRPYERIIMEKYYKKSKTDAGEPALVLKSTNLTHEQKRSIVRILQRRYFYRYENLQNVQNLQRYYRDR